MHSKSSAITFGSHRCVSQNVPIKNTKSQCFVVVYVFINSPKCVVKWCQFLKLSKQKTSERSKLYIIQFDPSVHLWGFVRFLFGFDFSSIRFENNEEKENFETQWQTILFYSLRLVCRLSCPSRGFGEIGGFEITLYIIDCCWDKSSLFPRWHFV